MRGSFDHHEDHADRHTVGDDDDKVFGDDDGLVMTMILVLYYIVLLRVAQKRVTHFDSSSI